ncbi:hypothetical protein SGLAM104S_09607 [Streptomyces glaucescens]
MTSTPTGARQDFDPSQTTQLRVPAHRMSTTGTFRRIKKALPKYDYEHYSRLAGPLTQPDPHKPYQVQYRSLISQEPHRIRVALMLMAAPVLSVVLLVWLLQPEHWTDRDYPQYDFLPTLDVVMLVSIGLIEFFRCMNVLSNAHATLVARDPIPVVPETGTRVAFLTSFVPGKEPLEMVTKTLEAAVRIRHRGVMHVWLLDEGDDPEVKEVCARLGVRHFSRKGVARWNKAKGPHRAKTKHGNYNAWLDAHGDDYDFFASVDTDHVPLPNYLERMLGFFRDPDVGFVIGPQVYGNYDNFVTKAAESQQFLFHALIQQAATSTARPCSSAPPTRCASGRSSRSAVCTTRSPRTWRPVSRSTATRTRRRGRSGARCTPRTCSPSVRGRAPGRTSSPSRCAGRAVRTRRSSSSTGRAGTRCLRASSSTTR